MQGFAPALKVYKTTGSLVKEISPGVWHLEIPATHKGKYQLAQLDDYHALRRSELPWQPPLHMVIEARASAVDLPGTWGFGLWNDPFSLSLGFGGGERRFPALPNTAWFFYASPPNYLSFRNDLPAQGFLAATFRSPHIPAIFLALAAPLGVLMLIPGAAQLGRWMLRRLIRQDACRIDMDFTARHTYELDWSAERVQMSIDGNLLLDTPVAPLGPLSLVLWIDNQYAALPPRGVLAYGSLPVPQLAWLELSVQMHKL